MSKEPSLLGIDYGESNIGIAFGRAGSVNPLRVISGKSKETAISEILRIVEDYDIDKIVLGIPLTFEGKETPKSLEVRKFAKLMRIKIKKPVIFVNEHSTSKKATKVMLNMGVPQKARQEKDHYSAALILKKYFREKES